MTPLTASELATAIKAAMRKSLMSNTVEAEQSANVDRLLALASQSEEQGKDAGRYRWLRDHADHETHFDHTISNSFGGCYHEVRVSFESQSMRRGPTFEQAIDAAMAAPKEGA